MKLQKKKLVLIGCAVVLLGGAVTGGALVHRNNEQRRMEIMLEAETQAHRERVAPYIRLNYAFGRGSDPTAEGLTEWEIEHFYAGGGQYRPPREIDSEKNRWGLDVDVYLYLRFYERETGIVLSYDLVIDYFLEEFEPDGSLRLYNNGNHPEIQAFVEWMWEGRWQDEVRDYILQIELIYSEYTFPRREDSNFTRQIFYQLSPQMLDALARAEADPDYVLDLTSIQQAGY